MTVDGTAIEFAVVNGMGTACVAVEMGMKDCWWKRTREDDAVWKLGLSVRLLALTCLSPSTPSVLGKRTSRHSP